MQLSPLVVSRLQMIGKRTKVLNQNPRTITKEERVEISMMLAITLTEFRDFAYLGMQYLGFNLTDMQADIADYMQHGPRKRMVQAQRGEAKSTLAALYAVWRCIQDQGTRILVVSAGETQASEVATLIKTSNPF